MICLTFLLKPEVEEAASGSLSWMPVAIQWHISLHSGLSLLGASGSVRARVSCGLLLLDDEKPGTWSMSWTSGASWSLEGLMVLPTSAVAFSQKMDSVSLGSNTSMTVGMISAILSLWKYQYASALTP